MEGDVYVAFVATNWSQTFDNFRRSLHVNNYSYSVLGWGEEWKGWRWRMEKYVEFLKSIDPKTLVIFSDSYDVIAKRSSNEFRSSFEAFQTMVVVGSEWYCGNPKNCGKINTWWKKSQRKPTFRKYINAGCIAGYCGVLKEMYEWILKSGFKDDQLGVANWMNDLGSEISVIDTNSAIFHNAHILDPSTIPTTSFFVHFPGPLLKFGLFPSYNKVAQKALGNYARKQYPHEVVDFVMWILRIAFLFLILPSLIHRVKPLK